MFNQLPSSHIPLAIATTEMEKIVATLRASSLYLALVMKLYDKFHDLSVPLFVGHQMKLPCLVFKLGAVAATSNASGRVFHAQTDVLGFVEITGTEDDLSRLNPLYLVHPWTDLLFGHEPVGSIFKKIPEENADLDDDDQSSTLSEPASFAGPSKDTESLQPLCVASQVEDEETQALQLIAGLKQPFDALLLAQNPEKIGTYTRVARDAHHGPGKGDHAGSTEQAGIQHTCIGRILAGTYPFHDVESVFLVRSFRLSDHCSSWKRSREDDYSVIQCCCYVTPFASISSRL